MVNLLFFAFFADDKIFFWLNQLTGFKKMDTTNPFVCD
jgi:hypothetical protein